MNYSQMMLRGRVIGHGRLLSVFHHILSQQNIFLEQVI